LISLGLFFLILAAIALWITRKGGQRTRRLFGLSMAFFHLSAGAQLAIISGAIPEGLAQGFDTPEDFSRINLVLAYVSQAAFLAFGGVLVCCVLTVRRMLQR
jgi:hypothetical protein